MIPFVSSGALLRCSHGSAQSVLVLAPSGSVWAGGKLVATAADHLPLLNILPFGICTAPGNPRVVLGGAIASAPCLPRTGLPWQCQGQSLEIEGKAALTAGCRLRCQWGGQITVAEPGQSAATLG